MQTGSFSNSKPGLSGFELAAYAAGALVLLFVAAPLCSLALRTSLPSLFETARDAQVLRSIRLSLLTSLAASMLFSIPAIPFAWLLARRHFFLKGLMLALIDLPVVVPHSTAGIALLSVLGGRSCLGGFSKRFGLSVIDHPAGIALAMAFVSLPFLVNSAREGFAAVPERLEKAALNLGASQVRVFFTVSVPLAARAILTGLVMMFARGLSEFGAVLIVAYHPMTAPVLIYDRLSTYGLRHAGSAALLFLAVSLVVFVVLRTIAGGRHHARS